MSDVPDDSGAVIVCIHVAKELKPLMFAARTEPVDSVDSGWQFHCGVEDHHDAQSGRVWSVKDVLRRDPTLESWIEAPVGTRIQRSGAGEAWERSS